MAHYTFHDLTLEVEQDAQTSSRGMARLLHQLSWVETGAPTKNPSLRLDLRLSDNGPSLPGAAREVFRAAGIRGLRLGEDFYLTEGTSVFHLQPAAGQGRAHLAPAFFDQPPLLRQSFWGFGLIKLLRPLGLFILHTAALLTPEGEGLLLAGESGSGKSTLTIGLIRQGWRYLTDDAVLLRRRPDGVEALALRKHLWIDVEPADTEAVALRAPTGGDTDLPLGEVIETAKGLKRRVRIEEVALGRQVPKCLPRWVVFPRIVTDLKSTLRPTGRVTAVHNLLEQSGPQLFERATMPHHLELLGQLARQAALYELRAGRDLHHRPEEIVALLSRAREEGREEPA